MSEPLVICHPVVNHSLTLLRDRQTGTAEFRRHAGIVSTVLLIEATRSLRTERKVVSTPLADMQGFCLADELVVVPVLRAGVAMLSAAQALVADVPVGFLGLERDEHTAIAREYYQKFPPLNEHTRVLVLDPMLATGGSLCDTINAVQRRGASRITVVSIVAAPEGIARIRAEYPETEMILACVDSHLDARKFIVPGLGDFGDRYFGTCS